MSRTKAHVPFHVRARAADDAEIIHNGCHLDPSGKSRHVGWEILEIEEEPTWHAKEFETTYTERVPFFRTLEDGHSDILATRPHRNGVKWVFTSETRTVRVPVYEVVDCDVDNPYTHNWRSCHYESEKALDEAYGKKHKCHWPKNARRELWYKPERQESREFCRNAAEDYNAFGDILHDEPNTPGSPRGLWGGGWVD